MEIRDSLNKNKKVGIGVGVAILILAVGLIAFQLRGSGGGLTPISTAYYTDDDGKTFFKDDVYKVSPFDHNGKQAYRADVFQCPDGKQFVGLIYRHTAVGRKAIEEHAAKGGDDHGGAFLAGLEVQGTEVKAAGAPDKAWRPGYEAEGLRGTIRCGPGEPTQLVTP